MSQKRVVLERTYQATLAEVWELWTTKEGIESWWGPEGFAVTVREIDLRPGGVLLYDMTAVAPEQIEFMKQHGMPVTTRAKITYKEVVAQTRLLYTNLADFIPGVEPYDVDTRVEFAQDGAQVRMALTLDAMHDDVWTQRATMGWESELGKLARLIENRKR
jgi:uncharacterized protein YndB with AHSA1/START domain